MSTVIKNLFFKKKLSVLRRNQFSEVEEKTWVATENRYVTAVAKSSIID